ncbi:MAG: hypothetical protein KIT84_20240 [Labilithrix sp.]|nr:hypothetical protein [Labilithrix sp.]MCW5813370.1 hypothetical protein [Labilithrix sp.]
MPDDTVQLEAEECLTSEKRRPIVGYKNGRPVFAGHIDTTSEGIVRACELITELALRAEREGEAG